MNKFKIFVTNQFLSDLEKDFAGQRDKIKLKLANICLSAVKSATFFGKNIKKLVNYDPETWRYRIGNYRFFYTTDKKQNIVFMLAIDVRENSY